jgi:hypothetical protein
LVLTVAERRTVDFLPEADELDAIGGVARQ